LIELFAHTIPAFGHVRHVAELLFESAHQPLKLGITSSNHRAPQVSSVYAALQNDWESRLALEMVSDKPHSARRLHRIQRLLLGRDFPVSLSKESIADTVPLGLPYLLDRLARMRRSVYSVSSFKTEWVLKGEFVPNPGDASDSLPYPGDLQVKIWLLEGMTSGRAVSSNGIVTRFERAER
jgi:hypothetical protein